MSCMEVKITFLDGNIPADVVELTQVVYDAIASYHMQNIYWKPPSVPSSVKDHSVESS